MRFVDPVTRDAAYRLSTFVFDYILEQPDTISSPMPEELVHDLEAVVDFVMEAVLQDIPDGDEELDPDYKIPLS